MDFSPNPVSVAVSGTLFVVYNTGSAASNYYCVPVHLGTCCFHILCAHVAVVVDHIYTGDVAIVLCGMSGWEAYMEALMIVLGLD